MHTRTRALLFFARCRQILAAALAEHDLVESSQTVEGQPSQAVAVIPCHCPHCLGSGPCPAVVDSQVQTTTHFHPRDARAQASEADMVVPSPVVISTSLFGQLDFHRDVKDVDCPSDVSSVSDVDSVGLDVDVSDPPYFPELAGDSDNIMSEAPAASDEDDTCSSDSGPVRDRKYVVWGSQLDKLFRRCATCGEGICHRTNTERGSLLLVQTTCVNGHKSTWESQPTIGRGAARSGAGSWLIPAPIPLCGGLFSAFSLFADVLNLAFVCERTFYYIHSTVLCPVVNKAWQDHVRGLHVLLEGEAVQLCGDARCDSPSTVRNKVCKCFVC